MSNDRSDEPAGDRRPDDVETAVRKASRDALIAAWRQLFRQAPPAGISRRLLAHAAAWQMQAERNGGLGPATKRRLRRLAAMNGVGPAGISSAKGHAERRPHAPGVAPGMRLVRDWGGRTHTVDITDAGAVYEGRTYRSLSAVAKAITGARWSGPRFFGLGTAERR